MEFFCNALFVSLCKLFNLFIRCIFLWWVKHYIQRVWRIITNTSIDRSCQAFLLLPTMFLYETQKSFLCSMVKSPFTAVTTCFMNCIDNKNDWSLNSASDRLCQLYSVITIIATLAISSNLSACSAILAFSTSTSAMALIIHSTTVWHQMNTEQPV